MNVPHTTNDLFLEDDATQKGKLQMKLIGLPQYILVG